MKQNFIITFDKNTANLLSKSGFTKIKCGNVGSYTFINDNTLKFDKSIDVSKIKYSNMLCI